MRRKDGGIDVPGGVVRIDIYRGRPKLWVWLRMTGLLGGPNSAFVNEDIVICDPSGTRELFREGPYDSITVNRPLQRIVDEINRVGLEEFLRIQHVQVGQLGPLRVPSDRLTFWGWVVASFQGLKRRP